MDRIPNLIYYAQHVHYLLSFINIHKKKCIRL